MPGLLLHQPSFIVRRVLIDLGFGTNPSANLAWPMFDNSEPDSPDNVITIYDTSGKKSGRVMFSGETDLHHGIQIRVRGADAIVGYTKAMAIANGVDVTVYREVITIDSTEYIVQEISRTSDVLVLGKETPKSKRSLFTINAVVSLRQTN